MQNNPLESHGAIILVESFYWPSIEFRPVAIVSVSAEDIGADGLITSEGAVRLFSRVVTQLKDHFYWGPVHAGAAGGFRLKYSDAAPREHLVEWWTRITQKCVYPKGYPAPENTIKLSNRMRFYRLPGTSCTDKPVPFMDMRPQP